MRTLKTFADAMVAFSDVLDEFVETAEAPPRPAARDRSAQFNDPRIAPYTPFLPSWDRAEKERIGRCAVRRCANSWSGAPGAPEITESSGIMNTPRLRQFLAGFDPQDITASGSFEAPVLLVRSAHPK